MNRVLNRIHKDILVESLTLPMYDSFSDAVAMERLALCYEPRDIGSVAYKLYEDFRPGIPDGVQGWGAKGLLDLSKISAIIALVKTI